MWVGVSGGSVERRSVGSSVSRRRAPRARGGAGAHLAVAVAVHRHQAGHDVVSLGRAVIAKMSAQGRLAEPERLARGLGRAWCGHSKSPGPQRRDLRRRECKTRLGAEGSARPRERGVLRVYARGAARVVWGCGGWSMERKYAIVRRSARRRGRLGRGPRPFPPRAPKPSMNGHQILGWLCSKSQWLMREATTRVGWMPNPGG